MRIWRNFEKAVAAGATRLNGRATFTRASHKDGRELYVEMTFALVLDPHCGVCGSTVVAKDVTAGVDPRTVPSSFVMSTS
jgi:hypothetical protein